MRGATEKNNQDIRFEALVPDFIPYACHYDASTLLTKNGELLQTLKIVGFSYETADGHKVDLREIVRKAILQNITNSDYAVWFHTVRRKKSLDPNDHYPLAFAHDTHQAWSNKNYWHDKYVNELYITVVAESEPMKLRNLADIVKSFSFAAQRKKHEQALDIAYEKLDRVVENMLGTLAEYGARRLTIMIDDDGPYSESLQFFDKIIHLTERRTPVPIRDLSQYLATHKIAFGNNTFEVKDKNGRSYGAILSVKEYHEFSTKALDKFIQLPLQLIITQSFVFTVAKEALKQFEYQDYILSLSGDTELGAISGLDDLLSSNKGRKLDYCLQQITVTLISETIKKLETEMLRANNELVKLGIMSVREDIHLENCFWAQLPANFPFIKRQSILHTKAVGGFASLHNFPAGRTKSIWGNALTLFRTAIGTPYFFNFHLGENGNTLIVGPEHSGKATLINFLISEASKYKPQMFVLDYKQCSRLSVKALGGCYRVLSIDETSLKHNPLLLDDNTANRDFLAKWLGFLIYGFKANSMDQHTEKLFTQVVNEIFRLEPSQRRLRNIAQFFTDPALLDGLAIWHSGGIYASLFDNEQDEFNQPGWFSRDRINAIDISWIFEDDARLTLPVITYYLHQFNIALDHHPDMIVIHEAWQIFSHGFFNSYLKEWLRYLVENNAMALLSIQINASEAQPRELADILIEHCATKVYLPTEEPLIYKRLFKLSDQELAQVKNMKVLNRHFLLQQDEDSVVAELNLAGLDHIVAILSSDPKAETLVEEVITEKGEKPEDWLPVFYQRYK